MQLPVGVTADVLGIRRGTVLVQGMVSSVNCVATHPKLPRLVILCDSGDIHLWDYNLKARNRLIACLARLCLARR